MPVRTRSRSPAPVMGSGRISGSITIPDQPWPPGAGSDYVVSTQSEVMRDNPTPGFTKKRNQGDIIVTPMSIERSSMDITVTQYRVMGAPDSQGRRSGYAIRNHDGGLMGYGIPISVVDEQARTRERLVSAASVACLASVAEPSVESLVSVAEAKQTFAFLASPFAAALKLARGFRNYNDLCMRIMENHDKRMTKWSKRNPKHRGDPPTLKLPKWRVGRFTAYDIPSAWLALRYGLMPIYYDINGIMEAASKQLGGKERKTYRSSRQEGSRWDIAYPPSSGGYTDTYQVSQDGDCLISVRAGCVAEYSADVNQVWGTHASYIPSAMWELTTLSFAVDWIVNVGDWLKALTVSARAEIKGSWAVVTTDNQFTSRVTGSVSDPRYVVELIPPPKCVRKHYHKDRRIDIAQFVRVTRDVNMNLKRYADLAALFSLLVFGRKAKR